MSKGTKKARKKRTLKSKGTQLNLRGLEAAVSGAAAGGLGQGSREQVRELLCCCANRNPHSHTGL
jgi:hypothetical protein